ncbi:hypothetical protein CVT26_009884 [Gymnopilus dilepis]|uniref:Uncharacterized protein n=1 Tax=Gymnopilus dilepis TaxID=231916 RepID=A0A409YC26_9AGAR|nr:hypothetical protein CVT26_009884 [Gymnopilus dilepis]
MDIATTVFQLTVGIVNFISEHEDKDALRGQISSIALQIQNVVAPLLLRDITDEPLRQVLHSLQHTLSTVDCHIRSWKESRSKRMYAAVNPWAVSSELREDREQLMQQYIMLMGAMQVVDHVKGYRLLLPDGADPPTSAKPSEEQTSLHTTGSKEVEMLQFWRSRIGQEVEVAEARAFCRALSSWLGKEFNDVAQKRLLLRLDERQTGHVTLKALQDLVQDDGLERVVNIYTADPSFPLLVWISDDLTFNKKKVAFAQSKGLCVVQLSSTTTAKAWLKINKGVLKKHDNPGDLRFISDQARRELNKHGIIYNNRKAGEHITRFIRQEGFQAPILVYTSKRSVNLTRYVESFPSTGSIGSHYKVYAEFVSCLARRRGDDAAWVGFNR